jgi:hypothetical protein
MKPVGVGILTLCSEVTANIFKATLADNFSLHEQLSDHLT